MGDGGRSAVSGWTWRRRGGGEMGGDKPPVLG